MNSKSHLVCLWELVFLYFSSLLLDNCNFSTLFRLHILHFSHCIIHYSFREIQLFRYLVPLLLVVVIDFLLRGWAHWSAAQFFYRLLDFHVGSARRLSNRAHDPAHGFVSWIRIWGKIIRVQQPIFILGVRTLNFKATQAWPVLLPNWRRSHDLTKSWVKSLCIRLGLIAQRSHLHVVLLSSLGLQFHSLFFKFIAFY